MAFESAKWTKLWKDHVLQKSHPLEESKPVETQGNPHADRDSGVNKYTSAPNLKKVQGLTSPKTTI
jgi:hypothetical protein